MKSIQEYQKEYDILISTAKNQSRNKLDNCDPNYIYYEEHHIIPECFFKNRKRKGPPGSLDGNPDERDNLILLTPEEHFDAHQLLALIYPNNQGLLATVARMSKDKTITRIEYGELRKQYSDIRSQLWTGTNSPMFGKGYRQIGADNHMYGRTGNKHHGYNIPRSEEVKSKISRNHHDVSGSNNPRSRHIFIKTPHGEIIKCFGNFKQFCKMNNLPFSMMNKMLKLKRQAKFGKCAGYYCWYPDGGIND